MSFLGISFNSSADDVPLCDRDEITINGHWDTGGVSKAISFNHIIETGKIPRYDYSSDPIAKLTLKNQKIDWTSDDAFTRAIKKIEQSTFEIIEQSANIQNLLAQTIWTKQDRIQWEQKTSQIISAEVTKTPGLNEYRTRGHNNVRGFKKINAIASDIKNDTTKIEFDCKIMSIINGIILQKTDDHFLHYEAEGGDYKKSCNYFFVGGRLSCDANDNMGPHSFIVSSATANIIETTATRIGNIYKKAVSRAHNFEWFITGYPNAYIDDNGSISVYGGTVSNEKAAKRHNEAKVTLQSQHIN